MDVPEEPRCVSSIILLRGGKHDRFQWIKIEPLLGSIQRNVRLRKADGHEEGLLPGQVLELRNGPLRILVVTLIGVFWWPRFPIETADVRIHESFLRPTLGTHARPADCLELIVHRNATVIHLSANGSGVTTRLKRLRQCDVVLVFRNGAKGGLQRVDSGGGRTQSQHHRGARRVAEG